MQEAHGSTDFRIFLKNATLLGECKSGYPKFWMQACIWNEALLYLNISYWFSLDWNVIFFFRSLFKSWSWTKIANVFWNTEQDLRNLKETKGNTPKNLSNRWSLNFLSWAINHHENLISIMLSWFYIRQAWWKVSGLVATTTIFNQTSTMQIMTQGN